MNAYRAAICGPLLALASTAVAADRNDAPAAAAKPAGPAAAAKPDSKVEGAADSAQSATAKPSEEGASAPALSEDEPERAQTASDRRRAREELERELGAAATDEEGGMGAMLLRTFVVLAIVVLSIYLTLNFGLRRMMGLKGPVGKGGLVSVIERVPLDQRRALFVVKAAGEYLLLGGGEGNLSLVCKLSTDDVDRITREQPGVTNTLSPFLEKLLSRRNPPS